MHVLGRRLPNGKPQERLRFRDLRSKTLAFKKTQCDRFLRFQDFPRGQGLRSGPLRSKKRGVFAFAFLSPLSLPSSSNNCMQLFLFSGVNFLMIATTTTVCEKCNRVPGENPLITITSRNSKRNYLRKNCTYNYILSSIRNLYCNHFGADSTLLVVKGRLGSSRPLSLSANSPALVWSKNSGTWLKSAKTQRTENVHRSTERGLF